MLSIACSPYLFVSLTVSFVKLTLVFFFFIVAVWQFPAENQPGRRVPPLIGQSVDSAALVDDMAGIEQSLRRSSYRIPVVSCPICDILSLVIIENQ